MMEDPGRLGVLLRDLISHPAETEWIEFKENNEDPHAMGENLSALSNSALLAGQPHGYLCFGIENATHRLVGTRVDPSTLKVGAEPIEPWLARMLEPRVDFSIRTATIDGLPIVIFEVDAARSRPVAFSGVEYIRIGSHKKKLKDYPDREGKIWNKARGIAFEEGIAAPDLDEEKILSLLDIGGFFDLFGQTIPDRAYTLDLLERERLLKKEKGQVSITNLGAILIAKDLRQFPHLARKAVRVIQYRGKGRTDAIAEQEGRQGYASGYQGLISYIMDRLKTGETIERGMRKEGSLYPEIIVREIVTNALIHQDFDITGAGPMIEIFSDRIEVTNPGKPIISTLRFIDHPPRSRNEQLAAFMRRAKICEERGSGIDKVVTELETHIMPPLRFIEEDDFFKVVVLSPRPFRDLEARDKEGACYQHACLRKAENSYMTNRTLRERFGIEEKNYSMVSRVINEAKRAGLIKDADPESKSRRDARYVPFYA